MPLARRDLLGLGATMALTLGTTSCRASGLALAEEETSSPSPAAVQPAEAIGPWFAGRPPPGQLYYGASLPHHRDVVTWEETLGSTLALKRSYFSPGSSAKWKLVAQCREDLAHGRLPHVSMKPPWTWEHLAQGRGDAWLTSVLRPLAAETAPIFFTLHHEPENDAGGAGMQPSEYVAMQRRLISVAAEVAPKVTIVPVLQQWTFDPLRGNIDPSEWIVSDATVVGLDLYNQWSPTNGKRWRSFGSKADEVRKWFGDTPLAIGEYGCREDPANPGLAAEWMRDAAAYARTHNIVSMSYFNSYMNSPDGSWELGTETQQAFAELLASDWVARLP